MGQKRPAWPSQRNPGGLKDALPPSPAPPSLRMLQAQLGTSCAGVTEICTDGENVRLCLRGEEVAGL